MSHFPNDNKLISSRKVYRKVPIFQNINNKYNKCETYKTIPVFLKMDVTCVYWTKLNNKVVSDLRKNFNAGSTERIIINLLFTSYRGSQMPSVMLCLAGKVMSWFCYHYKIIRCVQQDFQWLEHSSYLCGFFRHKLCLFDD